MSSSTGLARPKSVRKNAAGRLLDEHVARLDVAVDETLLRAALDRRADLLEHLDGDIGFEPAAVREALAKRLALDVAHDDEEAAPVASPAQRIGTTLG